MEMKNVLEYVLDESGLSGGFITLSKSHYDIQKYIEEKTIPTFSMYHQFTKEYTGLYLREPLNCVGNENMVTFKAPPEINIGLKIFSIGGLRLDDIRRFADAQYADDYYDPDCISEVALSTHALNNFPTLVADFSEPNLLTIRNSRNEFLLSRKLAMRVSYIHAKNLNTLPEGYSESFKRLALLDVMNWLYETELKHLDGASLGNAGSIDLKLTKFMSAGDDKQQLLASFKENLALAQFSAYYTE